MSIQNPPRVAFAEAQVLPSSSTRSVNTLSYPADESDISISTSQLSSINSQLITHGWSKRPLNLNALSERDHNEVVGVLFELLGAGVTNMQNMEVLSARHRTLTYEHERLTKSITNLQRHTAKLEAEVSGWKARYIDMEKRLMLEEGRTKELREDVGRGRKALEGVRIAAGHEAKKSQMKLDKAHSQLVKISNDASILSRPQGLILLNPISGGRSHPVAIGQPPLLEQSLKELAEIRHSLQEETEAFRHIVVSAGNGLREAIAAADGDEPPVRLLHSYFFANPSASVSRSLHHSTNTVQSASSTSHASIADSRLKSLISEVRVKLLEGVSRPAVYGADNDNAVSEEEMEERKRDERDRIKAQQDLLDRVKDLEVEVTCSRAREEEAKRLVEEFATTNAQARSHAIDEALNNTEDEELAEELAKEKIKLDEERRKTAQAAMRLQDERRQYEAERQAFLAERRKADTEEILAHLPTTPLDAPAITTISAMDPQSPIADAVAGTSSWASHRPSSPSPLSPQLPKMRTPKGQSHTHTAGRRRVKTPLSRLVLEKTARRNERDRLGLGAMQVEDKAVLGVSKRTNISPTLSSSSGGSKESVGSEVFGSKEKAVVGWKSLVKGAGATTTTLKPSVGPGAGKVVRDLSKSEGLGPRLTAKGAKVWR